MKYAYRNAKGRMNQPEDIGGEGYVPCTIVDTAPPEGEEISHYAMAFDDVSGTATATPVFRPIQAAPVEIPIEVPMGKARIALARAGLLASTQAAIDAMEGLPGEEARIMWEYYPTLRRDHPLVVTLAPALGITEAQMDELFVVAGSV